MNFMSKFSPAAMHGLLSSTFYKWQLLVFSTYHNVGQLS